MTKLVRATGGEIAEMGQPKNGEAPALAVGPPQPRYAGCELTWKSAFHGAEDHPWGQIAATVVTMVLEMSCPARASV